MQPFKDYESLYAWCDSVPKAKDTSDAARLKTLAYLNALIDRLKIRPSVPIFTVTGTNGKGTAVHALQQILSHHGLKVATFVSPHLLSYTERITINGIPVTNQIFLTAANIIIKSIRQQLGFFDFLFLIALTIFKQQQPDIIILEVGIGGRLDATNVLDAEVVILTSIDFDHIEVLGNTKEKIGFEKVALLRKNKVFVCGEPHPPTSIQEHVNRSTPHHYWWDIDFGTNLYHDTFDVWLPNQVLTKLKRPILILSNIACAITAITAFFGHHFLNYRKLHLAIANLSLPGRCQHIEWGGYEIILDVAHNPAASQHLALHLSNLAAKPTYAIAGIMQDKDIANTLKPLQPYVSAWWLCDLASSYSAKASELTDYVKAPHIAIHHATSIVDAWLQLQEHVPPGCRIVIFGSFRAIGPMLHWLKNNK